jgi:hypothetical protein
MVMNVGRQVDGKVRMQNAADAAAYSGGTVLARGMNTLAFTNHMLCDVFAVTAFRREARDRNSQSRVSDILAAWRKVAPRFSSIRIPKFQRLGAAIQQKVPLEQQMVDTYSEWAAASSANILPLMELILSEELIPKYQRAVVATFPDIAQMAALEVARRNGVPEFGRGPMLGTLWRTSGRPVGGDNEMYDPSLPVTDPVGSSDPRYMRDARNERRTLATRYLNDWNNQAMLAFDREAKMSRFSTLWRRFTAWNLERLLEEEYPESNVPFQMQAKASELLEGSQYLAEHLTYVGVVYWKKVPDYAPGIFHNPTQSDAVAFAQVQVFLPTQRLEWQWQRAGGPSPIPIGGVPGDFPTLPSDQPPTQGGGGGGRWVVGRQGIPTSWSLLTQHWNCQLVPATGPNLDIILQSVPPLPAFGGANLTPPRLGGLSNDDIGRISTH